MVEVLPPRRFLPIASRTGDFGELCTGGFNAGQCQGTISATNKQLINPVTHAIYANNIVPVDAIAAKVLPYLTTPNTNINGFSLANPINWQGVLSSPVTSNQNLERVDWAVNDKLRVFGRYVMQSVNASTQSVNLANTAYIIQSSRNGAFGATYIFTPKLVNDLHLGFNTLNSLTANQQYENGQTPPARHSASPDSRQTSTTATPDSSTSASPATRASPRPEPTGCRQTVPSPFTIRPATRGTSTPLWLASAFVSSPSPVLQPTAHAVNSPSTKP